MRMLLKNRRQRGPSCTSQCPDPIAEATAPSLAHGEGRFVFPHYHVEPWLQYLFAYVLQMNHCPGALKTKRLVSGPQGGAVRDPCGSAAFPRCLLWIDICQYASLSTWQEAHEPFCRPGDCSTSLRAPRKPLSHFFPYRC